jgi:hypothetical protein
MKKTTSIDMALSFGLYVKRWQRWDAAGLQVIKIDVCKQIQCQRVLMQIER